jgi:DNA-binding response OmpR family regulator
MMSYKILVADDSPSTLKLLQMSFPAPEFEIIAFSDGQEVLDSLAQINPDAILLNLSIPHKNGYDLGEYIKNQESYRTVPLFLIKEAFEPLDKERLDVFEFDELIQKPFDSDALAHRVKALIEERRVPSTLPEEPVWEEDSAAWSRAALDETVRELVKHEVLDVERELEKRIKARILAELKMWMINSQKK